LWGYFVIDFNRHHTPIDFDGDLHRVSSCSDLDFEKSEQGRGATPGPDALCSKNEKIRMAKGHTDR
jgi:hypothetical protein